MGKLKDCGTQNKKSPQYPIGAPYRTDKSIIQAEFLVIDTVNYIKIPPVHTLKFRLMGM